jgi:hypothetical protein
MTVRRRVDQTRFVFPIGTFDRRPPAAPPDQSSNQVVPAEPTPAPELRTVYDDDQRAPGIDAEDEPDPPDEDE